ncbi:hypothetical protein M9458_051250, partial [Cirrhinus mrigala]
DLDVNPVVRDIMMNRTFAVISLHFADFATDDWVSWFTVKLTLLLPSLTAEMLQTATSYTDCSEYHIMYVALPKFATALNARAFLKQVERVVKIYANEASSLPCVLIFALVFDQMTSLRQQELAPVLLGYLKQRHASGRSSEGGVAALLWRFLCVILAGSTCGAWLEESFGKFSIYVDYKDLREINTGFHSVSGPACFPVVPMTVLAALDVLSTSQSGALNSAALINMVFERLENGNSFQNVEEFFVALTHTSQVCSHQ